MSVGWIFENSQPPYARGWLKMFLGFFDDSGQESSASARYVCLAGYLGRADWWIDLISEWQALLLYHGLPDFHMKVLMSQAFADKRGWDWIKRQEVVSDFIKALHTKRLTGFGVGIDAEYWKSLGGPRRALFGNAQKFAFQRIMRMISDRMEASDMRDDVELVFDHDVAYSGGRLNLYDEIKKRNASAKRFVGINFAEAHGVIPLQAADLLAWETRLHLIRRSDGKNPTPRYTEMMQAFATSPDLPYVGEFWDARISEEFLKSSWKTPARDPPDPDRTLGRQP